MNNNDEKPGRISRSSRFLFLSACLIWLAWSCSPWLQPLARADWLDDTGAEAAGMIPWDHHSENLPLDEIAPAAATEDRIAGLTYNPDERMVYFAATGSSNRNVVTVQWETLNEPWTSGYFVWRSEKRDGAYVRIHHGLILSRGGDTWGGFYTFDDYGVVSGRAYYYKVQEIENSGIDRFYGPVASDGSIDWDNCGDKDKVFISCFIGSLLF